MARWKIFIPLVLGALLATSSCSKGVPQPDGGSGAVNYNQAGSPIYPHTQEFETTKLHGTLFLKDKLQCAKCHGTDLQGGTASKVSCNQCHVSYPHSLDWASPQKHGVTFIQGTDVTKQQCVSCHSPGRPAGAVSCNGCHSAFPHSADFISGGHADLAVTPEGQCMTCHNSVSHDLPNVADQMSCTQCHSSTPHAAGWANPQNHGAEFKNLLARGTSWETSTCFKCHYESTDQNVNPNITCKDCHKAFPHSADFISGGHADLAVTPEGQCLTCHNSVSHDRPNVACTQCHSSPPHAPGWANPQNHGAEFKNLLARGTTWETSTCFKCHYESTDQNVNPNITCKDCHKAFPGAHTVAFKAGGDQHSVLAQDPEGQCLVCHQNMVENLPDYKPTGCAMCHRPAKYGDFKVGWSKKICQEASPRPSPRPSPILSPAPNPNSSQAPSPIPSTQAKADDGKAALRKPSSHGP